jgi:SAM-dependent methyltransferase
VVVSLRNAWEQAAPEWITWARVPGHDSYWRFHRAAFFALLPPPAGVTLDIGCGEGRVSRDLAALGHHVVSLDGSLSMAQAAASHPDASASNPGAAHSVLVADAARLPFRAASADLAVAFMSLQDVDDFEAAIAEAARVLRPHGVLLMAIVHPVNSVGRFDDSHDVDSPFVITDSWYERHRTEDRCGRDDLTMTFHSEHRPLSDYTEALHDAGFLIERLREPTDPKPGSAWGRIPMFLHLRAVKRNPANSANPDRRRD